MDTQPDLISVVIPFYKGNRYIGELLENLQQVNTAVQKACGAALEVIIVNDSPDVEAVYTPPAGLSVTLVPNPKNMGIHASRINGIRHAKGQWIQMLDQDDLLIPENYPGQLLAAKNADIVVGNCFYYYGEEKTALYANLSVMKYLITENRFLNIRNLIASPGHCLIRKSVISPYWLENPMVVNGSDDYYLWALQFQANSRFALNSDAVYIHRNSTEGNLSFDLKKMHSSNEEMCALLENAPGYPKKKLQTLKRSIVFKFLYDTHQLKLWDWFRYADKVIDNAIYKFAVLFLKLKKK